MVADVRPAQPWRERVIGSVVVATSWILVSGVWFHHWDVAAAMAIGLPVALLGGDTLSRRLHGTDFFQTHRRR
jgi:hypothetical protein